VPVAIDMTKPRLKPPKYRGAEAAGMS